MKARKIELAKPSLSEFEGEQLLTAEDTAKRLNVSVNTLDNWRSLKKGPSYIKIGRGKGSTVLYKLDDVLEYKKRQVVYIKIRKAK